MSQPEEIPPCPEIHAWEFVGFKKHVFHRMAQFHPEVADYETVYQCQRCKAIEFGCNLDLK